MRAPRRGRRRTMRHELPGIRGWQRVRANPAPRPFARAGRIRPGVRGAGARYGHRPCPRRPRPTHATSPAEPRSSSSRGSYPDDARGQHIAFDGGRGQRGRLQLAKHLAHAVDSMRAAPNALPASKEARVRRTVDRLDILSQARERATTKRSQDIGVAPLAFAAARAEVAVEHRSGLFEPLQRLPHERFGNNPPFGRRGSEEWRVGARVARQQPVQRRIAGLEEHGRHRLRRGHAEGVAEAARRPRSAIQRSSPPMRTRQARWLASSASSQSSAADGSVQRTEASNAVRSPRRRKRSWTWSAFRALRFSTRHWSSSSTAVSASGSNSSRSSSSPSRSRRRLRSRVRAWARRSARGASPSYMYAAM